MNESKTLIIKGVKFSTPYIAGPMASLSDIVLRNLIAEYGGAGILYTEMLDCRRIVRDRKLLDNPRFKRDSKETSTFFQIFGSNQKDIVEAIKVIKQYLRINDAIDINMGCSAPKIKKQTAGVMLMDEKNKTAVLIKSIRDIYDGILTVKLRTGLTDNIDYTIEFIKALETSGIDAVAYHPRTSDQKLKNRAKWQYIDTIKQNINIPVIGNGDIFTVEDALEKRRLHKADGIMISRASAIKPWIFKHIQQTINDEQLIKPDYQYFWNYIYEGTIKNYSPQEARVRLNRWAEYFSQNFSFGHSLWKKMVNADSLDELNKITKCFITNNT